MGHNQGIPFSEHSPEREVVKSSLVQGTELGKKGNQVNTAHKQYALHALLIMVSPYVYTYTERCLCVCKCVLEYMCMCTCVCESIVIL